MGKIALEKLQAVPMFAVLSESQLALITPFFQWQRYRKGQAIALQGQHHNALFVIAKGRVLITTQLFSDKTVKITELGETDVFGEISLLLPEPSSATVRATTATQCFVLSQDLLYNADNALVKQTYHPRMMTGLLNLGGFGLAAWHRQFHQTEKPFLYKTQEIPVYDQNLQSLSNNFSVDCFLGHVRGVAYTADHIVMRENAHPFYYDNTDVVFAHNGTLARINTLKPELFRQIKPEFSQQIIGTTDSEWMYALFLSQLKDPENTCMRDAIEAVQKTLAILAKLRSKVGVAINSPINLFISNGKYILATRFVFDYGLFQHTKYRGKRLMVRSIDIDI